MINKRDDGLNVAFIHPDLGIGGAERLVVDAALAAQDHGHNVRIFTSHHDRTHCFKETREVLYVAVVGDWLPRSICGRFHAFCAYLRMIVTALYVVMFSGFKPDVVFCDQVSACIPVLRLFSSARIVFYCHFPDQLLTDRKSFFKALYRAPIDWLEERTTGMADKVLVNSKFTAGVFRNTFKNLTITPDILYPSLNTKHFDSFAKGKDVNPKSVFTFLSINRYERKKNLGLALKAFAKLRKDVGHKLQLIMAGGYDPRVSENMEYFLELQKLAKDLDLVEGEDIVFMKSPSDQKKLDLLHSCHALIYTPANEHFGIVPIEAMYCRLPVIAVNNGGPTETVVDGKTGYLRNQDEESFSEAMAKLVNDRDNLRVELGKRGRKRVQEYFSFEAFSEKLEMILLGTI